LHNGIAPDFRIGVMAGLSTVDLLLSMAQPTVDKVPFILKRSLIEIGIPCKNGS
jgi:hypothetical protein